MLPLILPGSTLHVRLANSGPIEAGDVVCFPGPNGSMIAHRVVGMDGEGSAQVLHVRGDAQAAEESIPREAVAYVVTGVEHPVLSYDTQSPLGRLLARVALRQGRVLRGAARLLVLLAGVRAALRAIVQREG